tara:strand:+ start:415 stop:672 length:258 start_codon:yes stop_codon:yes gene_type:complete
LARTPGAKASHRYNPEEYFMIILVNGENRDVESGTSIQGLLDSLDLDGSVLVVQKNDDIIEQADYGQVQLDENDQIELVQFVGGG